MWKKKIKLDSILWLCVFTMMFLVLFNFWSLSGFSKNSKALTKEDVPSKTEEKIVYLTFDDGPTVVTKRILEVLKEENVTGTFFVIGQLIEQNRSIAESVKNEGHAICIHTYTHEDKIYRNIDTFMEDYNKCSLAVQGLTGNEVSKFMRFPGGSSTTMARKPVLKEIRGQVVDRGLYYVDWNITIDDSLALNKPPGVLINKFYKEFKNNKKDRLIILMHDSYYNKTTVPALKEMIKALKEEGYTFRNFNDVNEEELKLLEERSLINKHDKKFDKQVSK